MMCFVGMTTAADPAVLLYVRHALRARYWFSSVYGSMSDLRVKAWRACPVDSDCAAIRHNSDNASRTCYLHKLSQKSAAELGLLW